MSFRIKSEGARSWAVDDDLGVVAKVKRTRDAIIIDFLKDDKTTLRIHCSMSSRKISEEEMMIHVDVKCDEVIIWNINSPVDPHDVHDEIGNIGEFLVDFFNTYQASAGVGCVIDGAPCKALIEVNFKANKWEIH